MSDFDLDIRVSAVPSAQSVGPNTATQQWSNCTTCDPTCTQSVAICPTQPYTACPATTATCVVAGVQGNIILC